MSEAQHRRAVREFTRIFKSEHNVGGVKHLIHADFPHHFRAPVAAGFEGLRQMGTMMNRAFPDVVVTEADLIADEDTFVERGTARATDLGNLMNEAPTRKPVSWSEIHNCRFRDGKIVKYWVEMSMLELLQQIVISPALA
jgi:predicted ester cyclase